ncbi:PE family protein, partial [Citrobacter youngae]|uniref:PE family protein n=1 Tax=Citrobacter youngae TaxID=133448 RepID=UPI0013D88C86
FWQSSIALAMGSVTQIAALFGAHARSYQALSTQAAAFHSRFVQALTTAAANYASVEATTLE